MNRLRSRLYIQLLEAEIRRLERVIDSKDEVISRHLDRISGLLADMADLAEQVENLRPVDELVAALADGDNPFAEEKTDLDSPVI